MINSVSFKGDTPVATPEAAPTPIPEGLSPEEREKFIKEHGGPGLNAPEAKSPEQTPVAEATPDATGVAAPAVNPGQPAKDCVSFSGHPQTKSDVKYEKTHVFRNIGAIGGAVTCLVGGILLKKNGLEGSGEEVILEKGALKAWHIAAATVGGVIGGALSGMLPDFMINKTVHNTMKSIAKNMSSQQEE